MKSISISTENIKMFVGDIFTKKYKESAMMDSVIHMLTDSQLEFLIHIMFKPDYELLNINDYVKFKPGKYEFEDWDRDIMIDKGIMSSDGYMYGIIMGDTGYGTDFNPTHYKLKVTVLLCHNSVIVQDHEVKTLDCIKIDPEDVKYNKLMEIWNEKV
jgi:hypothetical protein